MADVVVRSVPGKPFEQQVLLGRHALVADEPADAGGGDAGPGPYDLLLAALGTCKSMTVAMYAARKGWPLQAVSVRLRHDRIHAEDCAECETKTGTIDRIQAQVELAGDLTAEQRKRLVEIADKCPVHKTLTGEIRIETRAG